LKVRVARRHRRKVRSGAWWRCDAKPGNQAEFGGEMSLRGKLALGIHMLLKGKICTQVIGGRSVTDEDSLFTAKIGILAWRIK